jgi:hypothetical protein
VLDVFAEPSRRPPKPPWRDERIARDTLSTLAQVAAGIEDGTTAGSRAAPVDRFRLAAWLTGQDLSGVGFEWARSADPALASMLKRAAIGGAAGNLAHFETLDGIERRFESEGIRMVLLKGAAIACSAYADPAFRPMTDIDIWVADADVARAALVLGALGLRQEPGLPNRPPALQALSCGELVFRHARREHGLVELHYGAFQGWWVKRAARPDATGLWNRAQPMGPGRHALRLAVEDAILQTAFHVVVNQFGQAPWRGLMDLAVLARAYRVDWDLVACRARDWRLKTAIWLVLDRADRLIGLPGSAAAMARLRPARGRRAALRGFITPKGLLAGRDLTGRTRRHAFMLSLVDRPRDAARLIGRTLWPEPQWIAARYGRPVARVSHLWEVVRRGEV